MKKKFSKVQAAEKIASFFQKDEFFREEMKKIKRISMKYKLSLKDYRKEFCKKCLSKLRGKARITKTHKTIVCSFCSFRNRFKI